MLGTLAAPTWPRVIAVALAQPTSSSAPRGAEFTPGCPCRAWHLGPAGVLWPRAQRVSVVPGTPCGPSSLPPCTSGHAPFLSPCSAVPLTHVEVEGRRDRPPLVLLHGLFGSHSNFQTVAKTLAQHTGMGQGHVLTVDARNHGSSPHSPMMTYEAMSLDVQHLLSRLGITKCILVGHSMGGKTAMTLALQRVNTFLSPPWVTLPRQRGWAG
uniref:sn-1-specific diacylglycerol lipase ABHD11 n=1 Tax=Zonotrichia albicollis TaxID=44394 RepID=A0A8D2QAZ4_ZONAL